MKFLSRLESNYIRYSDLMSSSGTDPMLRPVITGKFNALRFIAFFMVNEFTSRLSGQYQLCVKSYISNKRNLKAAAAQLNISEEQLRSALSEVDNKMRVFVGEKTIENINRAKTVRGIQSALSHFHNNWKGFLAQSS